MLHVVRSALLLVAAIFLIVLAMANRQLTTLRLVPEEMTEFVPLHLSITLPVFAVGLLGILSGLLIGVILEWLREHKHRAAVEKKQIEVDALKRNLRRTKRQNTDQDDEILALIDDSR